MKILLALFIMQMLISKCRKFKNKKEGITFKNNNEKNK